MSQWGHTGPALHKEAWEPERRTLKINIAICEKKIKIPASLNCTELLFRAQLAVGMEGFACWPMSIVSILYNVDDRISSLITGQGGLVACEMSLPLAPSLLVSLSPAAITPRVTHTIDSSLISGLLYFAVSWREIWHVGWLLRALVVGVSRE